MIDEIKNCDNKTCFNEAILQFDHNGELVFYCQGCYDWFCHIMKSMGSFEPTAYPIGTKKY